MRIEYGFPLAPYIVHNSTLPGAPLLHSDPCRHSARAPIFSAMREKQICTAVSAIAGLFDVIRLNPCSYHKLSVCFFQVQHISTILFAIGRWKSDRTNNAIIYLVAASSDRRPDRRDHMLRLTAVGLFHCLYELYRDLLRCTFPARMRNSNGAPYRIGEEERHAVGIEGGQ